MQQPYKRIPYKNGVAQSTQSRTDRRAQIIKQFVVDHPEHREQVIAEMWDHRGEVPYIGQAKIVTGLEEGVDPDTLDKVTSQPNATTKTAHWATYDLIGREVHWQEMDDDG